MFHKVFNYRPMLFMHHCVHNNVQRDDMEEREKRDKRKEAQLL